jgi:hypothetical protein
MRFHHTLIALSLIAVLCACTHRKGTSDEPVQESTDAKLADDSVIVEDSAPDLLKGWMAETFALPPGFAPELPTGHESLLFAPGWRDPRAEDFWSYAFVMWINESAPGEGRMAELLGQYYDGLLSSFAAGKNRDISSTPVRVEVVRTATNRFEVKMRIIDALATFEPIELRVAINTFPATAERAVLHIQVSPQPKEHAIWRSLEQAIASIVSQDGALKKNEAAK